MDIRELSERVDQLSNRVSQLEHALAAMHDQAAIPAGFPDDPPSSEYPDVMEALQRGNKIEAIKRYREHRNVGLAEAKRAVEQMEKPWR